MRYSSDRLFTPKGEDALKEPPSDRKELLEKLAGRYKGEFVLESLEHEHAIELSRDDC